jgi:phospholipid/cholesterol/gamma-HCH transport system substrate-binding protein
MKTRSINNIKLGSFVLAGLVFLILCLYLIGKNRNLFGSTFTISADFHNVNGLMPGNNVRFAGIDVGTVKRLEIISDSTVRVYMIIDKDVRKHIKKNSIASVGTDGLMGNRLINVNGVPETAPVVEEGDVIASIKPVETDEMLRTLNTTNQNLASFSTDLKRIAQRINNSKGIWNLLSDTVITKNLETAAKNINRAALRASEAGEEITSLLQSVRQGGGIASTILTDTALSKRLKSAITNIQQVSEHTSQLTNNLNEMLKQVKKGQGAAGVILSDTAMERKLKQTISNLEVGTARFSEDMEAMKSNFLTRSYFKKQEKEMQKEKEKAEKDKKKKANP